MPQPLDGIRVLEVAQFAPNAVGMHLADLGAEVIKVEPPGLGDPSRLLAKPIAGESPAARRWNRGKQSIALDLRRAEGREVFGALTEASDAVIEGMRPGALERRGLGYETLLQRNPSLVFISVSGWGEDGPYRDLASHGLAFDAYAGLAPPIRQGERVTRPSGHVWQGLEAAPLYGALAVVSGLLQAKLTGRPARFEVSQADAGAVWNGWRIGFEAARSEAPATPDEHERLAAHAAAAEVTLVDEDSAEAAPQAGPEQDVRYQYYAARDGGVVLLMATERRFWENFCRAIDRFDLYERWPGEGYADHDYGNEALRAELMEVFATRTRAEWIALFIEHDVAGAPVYEAGETFRDPHFEARSLWTDPTVHRMAIPGTPLRTNGAPALAASPSPGLGEQTTDILCRVLGYDDGRIAALRSSGALGDPQ